MIKLLIKLQFVLNVKFASANVTIFCVRRRQSFLKCNVIVCIQELYRSVTAESRRTYETFASSFAEFVCPVAECALRKLLA